ncbi:MAG: cyanophycin synthetase [Bacteroidales bacterium]|jgi:cyanophycin synthetase
MQKTLNEYNTYTIAEGPLKVDKIQVMHGANYFSAGPIVLIRLNLGEYNEVFTNKIAGFPEKLQTAIPTLYQHHCSVGKEGGFLLRVNEGTLLGHVLEHVAIELQTLAGMDVGYGKTRGTMEEGVYNIIFRYFDEVAGVYAGKAGVNFINSLLLNTDFNIKEVVDNLIDIREKRLFGPSTQAIVNEADKRKIPWIRLDTYNLVQLGTGKYHKRIRATITSDTSLIAVETADNKYLTSVMLEDAGIPVPETIRSEQIEDIIAFSKRIQKPIVVKPCEGYLGKNLLLNLKTEDDIKLAFTLAKEYDELVLAQQHIEGKSFRLLVIDYKFVAATELTPAFIKGDGALSIQQLIDKLNAEPERQYGDKGKLTKFKSDELTEKLLAIHHYTYASVLPKDEILYLENSGNMKLGGSASDVTAMVHPFNIFLAERAAQTIGLNVAGVDFIAPDIATPINENGGVVLEVNAAPDFRMHLNPTYGKGHNVAKNLVDMLFPEKNNTRVPIFSITGTAGKTITATLLNYCLQKEGYTTGMTTSDGLFINGRCLMKGDMTYPDKASLVLKDSTIDCAILETSREGILRRGIGYKFADIGIVLNLHDDHVGVDDIKYIEDLAYAKSVVAEEVYEEGYSILNADNELVHDMKNRIYSKLVLFSKDVTNKEVSAHILKGGLAVNIKDDAVYLYKKTKAEKIIDLVNVPLTFCNKAKFMYDEILAATAAMAAYGIASENITKYLSEFSPSLDYLPGRMNMIAVKDFKVLLDNAHNSINFEGLKEFLTNFPEEKIGVMDAAGDRSDEEIMNLGALAAETYSRVIFYEGIDDRGREKGKITELLKQGAIAKGFKEENIKVIIDHSEAIKTALSLGIKGKLIVILSAKPEEIIAQIKQFN